MTVDVFMHGLARKLFSGWGFEVGIAQKSSWWVQGQHSAKDRLLPSVERANHQKQAGTTGATVFEEQHLYDWGNSLACIDIYLNLRLLP